MEANSRVSAGFMKVIAAVLIFMNFSYLLFFEAGLCSIALVTKYLEICAFNSVQNQDSYFSFIKESRPALHPLCL